MLSMLPKLAGLTFESTVCSLPVFSSTLEVYWLCLILRELYQSLRSMVTKKS